MALNRFQEMNLKFLHELERRGEKIVIEWCMRQGIVTTKYECPKCGKPMSKIDRIDNEYEWRCRAQGHNIKRSARKGSCFFHHHLSMSQILQMMYMWCHKFTNEQVMREVGVSENIVVEWKMFCREVCIQMLENESTAIGGPNVFVEIDEVKFGKRKFNLDERVEGKWIFIGTERESNKCFLRVVEDQTKEELLDVIFDNVLPGSTVISKCWRMYDCISDESFIDLQIKHNLVFKDPEACNHRKSSEGISSSSKKGMQARQISNEHDSFLAEYIWRRRTTGDVFMQFLKCLVVVYPPRTKD